jgi:hypothetical protein
MARIHRRLASLSPEEFASLRDAILDPIPGAQSGSEEGIGSSAAIRPPARGPTPAKARTQKKAATPVHPPKKTLAHARETMRYRPPAQSYWSADGFAFLMGWVHDLSPAAWKVATYVAYRQLRGVVFLSEPVAMSLREIAAGTGLGKTAVVDAIQEATACGILKSERHEKGALAPAAANTPSIG